MSVKNATPATWWDNVCARACDTDRGIVKAAPARVLLGLREPLADLSIERASANGGFVYSRAQRLEQVARDKPRLDCVPDCCAVVFLRQCPETTA